MIEPVAIKKLEEAVINRIAAGEVIQRPANALKEMIENSIDAKATNIQVVVKEGGLKLLQIIDNGTGIRKEDFAIVCERFTTSKLEKFEDLNSISTYGFRGEALASISHVAHLTIQSKTVSQDCAYKASYEDSKLKDSPKPCAGNQGTIITVEDLFYNMTTRKKALKNFTEEFRKIAEVVGKYAIHNASVSFGLKKYGENASIKTPPNSNPTDNIRIIYGDTIAKELLSFECKDDSLKFVAKGLMTNANYSTKKTTFILFINHRLVESAALRRCIELVYGTYLPKSMYPFVYLSLEIDPKNVDVNVHPTKYEVHFLHEEQIIDKLVQRLESKLLGSNNSRVFYTQSKLPGATEKIDLSDEKNKVKQIYDKDLVRTDSSSQKLDKYLSPKTNKQEKQSLNMTSTQYAPGNRVQTFLTSILRIRKGIEDDCHLSLREIFAQHVFVGCVDAKSALIQHNTKLFLCRTEKVMREMFYQLIMYNFENFGTITFRKPLVLKELALIALDLPEVGWTPEEGPKDELAEQVVKILQDKAEMLRKYYSFNIDENGHLLTIPLLIENHIPEVTGLPLYILRLASDVNWKIEKECFETFARETATYYAKMNEVDIDENENWKWTTEHLFYPTVKKYFLPPKSFTENASVLQLTDLSHLYKVFERC